MYIYICSDMTHAMNVRSSKYSLIWFVYASTCTSTYVCIDINAFCALCGMCIAPGLQERNADGPTGLA